MKNHQGVTATRSDMTQHYDLDGVYWFEEDGGPEVFDADKIVGRGDNADSKKLEKHPDSYQISEVPGRDRCHES